ncbi:G1/S-specific cyclin-D2-like [Limulus polyphemus]|uniref:G1/S-specific cyclin-D2-like n=1 Tax=Limulus polyphemus TaxID=6850 RepID=A0ABM1B1L4_LIMPO|nr:G1/S-specific cyclin-D2-like [Limulus polyphemus]
MEKLLCCDKKVDKNTCVSSPEPLLNSRRVLQNLLQLEDRYYLASSYFVCLQSDIKPYMREKVTEWMWEVCEGEHCQQDVFPLAVNCMDRFLSVVKLKRSQLQLLGTVCLFLASKLRQVVPLMGRKLCQYTDNSVTQEELLSWELLVLSRLKWDISAVIPNDFLEPLLYRLLLSEGARTKARQHAEVFINMCCTEFKFSMYPPSMVAAASVGAAVQGLHRLNKELWESSRELLTRLHLITGIEIDCLRHCLEQIEEMIAADITPTQTSPMVSLNGNGSNNNKMADSSGLKPADSKPETPTDVQDVHF